jgi:hypothetical protein
MYFLVRKGDGCWLKRTRCRVLNIPRAKTTLGDLSISLNKCSSQGEKRAAKVTFLKPSIIITLKSFFLAKRGLAETTISGGLLPQLLRQTLAAGEVEEDEEEPLPTLEVPLPTGDAEALPTGDAEALPTGDAEALPTMRGRR